MLYRKKAMDHIATPEELDKLLRITPPAGVLGVCVIAVVLACAVVWGFVGVVSTTVLGRGVLLQPGGLFAVESPTSGEVARVFFEAGDQVLGGQRIARLKRPDLEAKVADALEARDDAWRELERMRRFAARDETLREQARTVKLAGTNATMAELARQVAWYGARIEAMKPFVEDGTISKEELFEMEKSRSEARQQLREHRNTLQTTPLDDLEARNDLRKTIEGLEDQYEEAQLELAAARESLLYQTRIIAPVSGQVVEVNARPGREVSPGDNILTLEPRNAAPFLLDAILYFEPENGQRVRPGMIVQASLASVDEERYGRMVGVVTYVSEFPVSRSEMETVLENPQFVQDLLDTGVKQEIRCSFAPDPNAPSGLTWTSSKGPDRAPRPGGVTTAQVVVEEQRPISLIIPLLRRYVMGEAALNERMQ